MCNQKLQNMKVGRLMNEKLIKLQQNMKQNNTYSAKTGEVLWKHTVYGKLYQKSKKDYIECGANVVLIITG